VANATRKPNLTPPRPWESFKNVKVMRVVDDAARPRYSVTSDVLSFRRCARLYGFQSNRGYAPSQPTQEFVGIMIHQVLDRAHSHYMGRVDQSTRGSLPSDSDIERYFDEVEGALKSHGVRAVRPEVRTYALRILKVFNRVEGPDLYPRVRDTEHRLQSERPRYLLYGVVDVLASSSESNSPDEMEIWDYKATQRPDPKTKDGAARLMDYEFQMQVYADLYNLRNSRYPRRALVYFVGELKGQPSPSARPKGAILEILLEPAKIKSALNEFDKTIAEIEEADEKNEWRPPAGGVLHVGKETCDLCDVRWSCPEMGSEYRKTPRYP
jgi:hypothetical protein